MKVILTISLFFLLGCATKSKITYADLEISKNINSDFTKELSEKELEQDKQLLIHVLKQGYSGAHKLPQVQFEKLISSIEAIKAPLKVSEFCKNIAENFNAVSDNHLSAIFFDHATQKNKLCFEKPRRKATVGDNYFKSSDKFWDVRLNKEKGTVFLLVSISMFADKTHPGWNGFIEAVKDLSPKAKAVIIDLRGNGGGDDSRGYELSQALAGNNLEDPYVMPWQSLTPESMQLMINAFIIGEYFTKDPTPRPKFLQDLVVDYTAKRDLAAQGKLTTIYPPDLLEKANSVVKFDIKKSIQKPIYILMDARCFSSCESTIDAFEYNTLVKKVGENTGGSIHFGNNGLYVLKNSSVVAQIPTSFNTYKDNRFVEKIGIKPDISTPAGGNAMDSAINDFIRHHGRVRK